MNDTNTKQTVAVTIAKQLGGLNLLKLMAGCSNFLSSKEGQGTLTFKLGSGSPTKATHFKVTLTDMDDYTVTSYRIRGTDIRTLEVSEGIYCDNLIDVFERMTGFYLTARSRG
jgi:hypothetical protein